MEGVQVNCFWLLLRHNEKALGVVQLTRSYAVSRVNVIVLLSLHDCLVSGRYAVSRVHVVGWLCLCLSDNLFTVSSDNNNNTLYVCTLS